jgi:trehalose 6-phosphate phosphatase
MTGHNRKAPICEPWSLFFDFDGTLVEIADRPDAVIVPRELGAVLSHLAARVGSALAIITGRRVEEIDRMLSPFQLDVAGVHGAELRLVQSKTIGIYHPSEKLTSVVDELHKRFGDAGLLIENKGFGAAVHWRLQPSYEEAVLSFLRDAVSALGGDYRIQLGKAVAEVLPASSSKAKVIENILAAPTYRNRRPAFFGDDLTDESGFEFINSAGGLSVRIGSGPTLARFRLANPAALRDCIAAWSTSEAIDLEKDLGK